MRLWRYHIGSFPTATKLGDTVTEPEDVPQALWMEHLGLGSGDEDLVRDPTIAETYNGRWLNTALQNQSKFTNIFPDTPCDSLRSIRDVEEVKRLIATATPAEKQRAKLNAFKNMQAIRGHLVAYPLNFLKDEVLDAGFNIEALLPGFVYH
jgi:hypothetical protein